MDHLPKKENHIKTTVVIAGTRFPVLLTEDENLVVKKVEKSINEKIQKFRMDYPDMALKDCLSMLLFSQSMDRATNPLENNQSDQVHDLSDKILETIEAVE